MPPLSDVALARQITERPHCIPDGVLKSERARRNSAKRTTFGTGGGRPRFPDRCPCGEMTRKRAGQRGHVC